MALSDRDFLGLEVVGLDEASIVGSVRGLIVNDEARAVAALVVDVGAYQFRVVPYAAVRSVGMDAVVISSAADAVLVSEAPELEELAQRDVQLAGCFVLTSAGEVLGTIDEFFVDTASGQITELQVEPDDEDGEPFRVPADSLLKVGEDIAIISPLQPSAGGSAPRAVLDSDLVGLQIVARDKAAVIGEVDALIIDEDSLALAGFVVNLGLYEPLGMVRSSAEVIGPHAVIVASASAIEPLSAEPALQRLAERKTSVNNARAVTVSGKAIGTISSLSIDTVTGSVLGLQFLPAVLPAGRTESLLLPLSCVVKLGKGLAVVSDDYADHVTPLNAELAVGTTVPAASEKGAPEKTTEAVPVATEQERRKSPGDRAPAPEPDGEVAPPVALRDDDQSTDDVTTTQAANPQDERSAAPPETSSRHFLLGKRLLRRLELPSGEAIAEAGDVVTPELIAQVKEHNLLLVLSLNVE